MNKATETPEAALLARVVREFGEDCWAERPDRAAKADALCESLCDWLRGVGHATERHLGTHRLTGMKLTSTYSPKRGLVLCEARLRPRAQEHHGLSIEAKLVGRSADMREHITLSLHAGPESLPAARWLLARWRRVLELLLEPHRFYLDMNGGGSSRPYLVRRLAAHLAQVEWPDAYFSLDFKITKTVPERSLAMAALSLWAVYDALAGLQQRRAEPDALLKHYLALRAKLPRVPFRAKVELK